MKITAFKDRNLLLLGLSLGLLFFGWNGVEQHFASFFQSQGIAHIAYHSLAIIYTTIVIGNIFGPSIVSILGPKNALLWGFLTYVLLVFGITTKTPWLIYFLSVNLGIGAGSLGIACTDLLRQISPLKKRGEYSGTKESLRTLGGFLGVVSVSFFLKKWPMEIIFLLFGFIMALGSTTLFGLKIPPKKETKTPIFRPLRNTLKMLRNKKVLLLLPNAIAGGFLLGLVLSTIPVLIETNFGLQWVGLISSIWHLTLALFSLGGGILSDIKGRFQVIYFSIFVGILAVLLLLSKTTLPALALVMFLVGLSGSLGSSAGTALYIDLFEEKIKEASAALGILSLLLGTVPPFLANQILPKNQIFILAICFALLGAVFLRILEVKFKPNSNTS